MIKTLSFHYGVVPEIGNRPRWMREFSEWVTRGNRRVQKSVIYVVSDLCSLQPQSASEHWECVIDGDPVYTSESDDLEDYGAYLLSCMPTSVSALPFEFVENRSGESEWQAEDMEGDTHLIYVVRKNSTIKPQSDEPVAFRVIRQIFGTPKSRRKVFLVDILGDAHVLRAA